MANKENDLSLEGALQWLLDDLQDTGEHANPETGQEYDTYSWGRLILRYHTEGYSVLDVNGDFVAHYDSEEDAERYADSFCGASVVKGNRGIFLRDEDAPEMTEWILWRCPKCGIDQKTQEADAAIDLITCGNCRQASLYVDLEFFDKCEVPKSEDPLEAKK